MSVGHQDVVSALHKQVRSGQQRRILGGRRRLGQAASGGLSPLAQGHNG
jgi:hypothetical protein